MLGNFQLIGTKKNKILDELNELREKEKLLLDEKQKIEEEYNALEIKATELSNSIRSYPNPANQANSDYLQVTYLNTQLTQTITSSFILLKEKHQIDNKLITLQIEIVKLELRKQQEELDEKIENITEQKKIKQEYEETEKERKKLLAIMTAPYEENEDIIQLKSLTEEYFKLEDQSYTIQNELELEHQNLLLKKKIITEKINDAENAILATQKNIDTLIKKTIDYQNKEYTTQLATLQNQRRIASNQLPSLKEKQKKIEGELILLSEKITVLVAKNEPIVSKFSEVKMQKSALEEKIIISRKENANQLELKYRQVCDKLDEFSKLENIDEILESKQPNLSDKPSHEPKLDQEQFEQELLKLEKNLAAEKKEKENAPLWSFKTNILNTVAASFSKANFKKTFSNNNGQLTIDFEGLSGIELQSFTKK